jgi:hypothetical protein
VPGSGRGWLEEQAIDLFLKVLLDEDVLEEVTRQLNHHWQPRVQVCVALIREDAAPEVVSHE